MTSFVRLLSMSIFCALWGFHALLRADLDTLQERVSWELQTISFPGQPWLPAIPSDYPAETLDVAIVGGGMAGMTATFALQKQGIQHVKMFDSNPEGCEGPWATFARMKVLRSGKYHIGPAFWVPSLTFRAWYEAHYSAESWENLSSAATPTWMEYLCWYRHVLKLPVVNGVKLESIEPTNDILRLTFRKGDQQEIVWARKVVLATGRTGFGGLQIPEWVQGLPKRCYAHSAEQIDFASLSGKRVVVVGAGASGFDSAAVALENGAASVHMVVRRPTFNPTNKFAVLSGPGFVLGYYSMSDQQRWEFMSCALANGIPPPRDSLLRVQKQSNFYIHSDCSILSVQQTDRGIEMSTSQGVLAADYMILACGFDFDGSQRPELRSFLDKILLWEDRITPDTCETCPKLASAPYLGPHFQFLEKHAGTAPFLKHIYCFNFGAALSHGMMTGDIKGMSTSAARLAEGITTDFFLENSAHFYQKMVEFDKPTFSDADLAPFQFAPLPQDHTECGISQATR